MFDPTRDGRHWLWALVDICGLLSDQDGVEELTVSTPISEAWSRTAEACELSELDIASFVAYRFGLPLADVSLVDPLAIALVPADVARERLVLPLRADKTKIVVATADPTAFDAEQDLRFVSGRFPTFEISTPSMIREAIAA